MSSDVAVRFEGVSKRYRVRTGRALALDVLRPSRRVWRTALSDINMSVAHGERLALIGNNGAGKSTALRLLTRIARPSSGTITVNGSIGALLEVGSGINPEMSARENIWLYGNILGLTHRQVGERFDRIVEFAELGHVLDQQVKFFSSGMQLRLGFSIAAHLDPDILIVDEALAVGDVRFQRKCLDLMSNLATNGTTLLYVSHDLRTVEALCDRVIWLQDGTVRADGPMSEVVRQYLESSNDLDVSTEHEAVGDLRVLSTELLDAQGALTTTVSCGGPLTLRLVFEGPPIERPHVAVGFSSGGTHPFMVCSMAEHGNAPERVEGRWTCTLQIDQVPFRRGRVEIWLGVLSGDALRDVVSWHRAGAFAADGPVGRGPRGLTEVGAVIADHTFTISK